MDNQTRNHLNLQKHIADQDHIIRVRNAEITALRKRAEKAEQERPLTPSEALIERAEKAEMESARAAEVAERWREAYDDLVSLRRADDPRPLTPVVITDEMVERALRSWRARSGAARVPDTVRDMLAAALTEPPARPEGAERWEDFLIDSLDYQALTDQQITDLADRIAEEMNR